MTIDKEAIWALVTIRNKEQLRHAQEKVRQNLLLSFEHLYEKPSSLFLKEFDTATTDIEQWQKEGILLLPLTNPEYPSLLQQLYNPPLLLFVKAKTLSVLTESTLPIALVGSRNCDFLGERLAFTLAKALSECGSTIVSGLALGIDAEGHKGALLGGGAKVPTIAVLGNGLSQIYPSRHHSLAEKILAAGGALVSTYEPSVHPLPHQFLERNRIIAGLSHGSLVVQASARSGALSTARHAREEGREVMVLPGPVGDPKWEGSNQLLKEGATIVTSLSDIQEAFPYLSFKPKTPSSQENSSKTYTEESKKILTLVQKKGEVHEDELTASFPLDISEYLIELELQGDILRKEGGYYILSPQISSRKD